MINTPAPKLNESELEWLVENIDTWHFFDDAIATINNGEVKYLDPNIYSELDGLTKSMWLKRNISCQIFNIKRENTKMKEKYNDSLDFNLFEGDFGDSSDTQLTNKIVKVRKEHECHICSNKTQVGSYARYDVWIFDGEFMKYYVCQDCLDAIVQYENEEYDDEDKYDPIEKRYMLNSHI